MNPDWRNSLYNKSLFGSSYPHQIPVHWLWIQTQHTGPSLCLRATGGWPVVRSSHILTILSDSTAGLRYCVCRPSLHAATGRWSGPKKTLLGWISPLRTKALTEKGAFLNVGLGAITSHGGWSVILEDVRSATKSFERKSSPCLPPEWEFMWTTGWEFYPSTVSRIQWPFCTLCRLHLANPSILAFGWQMELQSNSARSNTSN